MSDEVIILTGIKETLDALKEFDKDAVKRFNNVVNKALSNAERDAQAYVDIDPPMRGWRKTDAKKGRTRGGAGWPGWNSGDIKTGIVKTKVQGKVRKDYTTSAGALKNKSAAGAIFEVAGRITKAGFVSGSKEQFMRTLTARFGEASRLVWRVVDKDKSRIEAEVARALDEAKTTLQTHLNQKKG